MQRSACPRRPTFSQHQQAGGTFCATRNNPTGELWGQEFRFAGSGAELRMPTEMANAPKTDTAYCASEVKIALPSIASQRASFRPQTHQSRYQIENHPVSMWRNSQNAQSWAARPGCFKWGLTSSTKVYPHTNKTLSIGALQHEGNVFWGVHLGVVSTMWVCLFSWVGDRSCCGLSLSCTYILEVRHSSFYVAGWILRRSPALSRLRHLRSVLRLHELKTCKHSCVCIYETCMNWIWKPSGTYGELDEYVI